MNQTQQIDTLINHIVDMIMEIKFRIQKYSQVFSTADTDYEGLAKFMLVDYILIFIEKV
jgi:hypothetical protein